MPFLSAFLKKTNHIQFDANVYYGLMEYYYVDYPYPAHAAGYLYGCGIRTQVLSKKLGKGIQLEQDHKKDRGKLRPIFRAESGIDDTQITYGI